MMRGVLSAAALLVSVVLSCSAQTAMTVIAGTGSGSDVCAAGSALSVSFRQPMAVAVGPSGNAYVVDTLNNAVCRIGPNGQIALRAGGGDPDTLGDGGVASSAGLYVPSAVGLRAFLQRLGRPKDVQRALLLRL